MAAIVAHIVHPVEVNQRLLAMERSRGVQIMRFALLMERVEKWPIDDIQTDSQGLPIAVNDERGTAEERLQGVLRLEEVLNSEPFIAYLRENADATDATEFDKSLIEVMALLRTSRFVICLDHMSSVSPQYVANWLQKLDDKASAGDVLAHVLRERLKMLRKANLLRAVFSKESVAQVSRILGAMH